METILDAALRYARRGWPVFPLVENLKKPITLHGYKDATTDEVQIKKWFSNRKHNIAIPMGKASGLWALDVDIRKNGPANVEILELMYGDLPLTLSQTTWSGGKHILFNAAGIKNTIGVLKKEGFPGIDAMSDGGYIVVAPSVIDGKPYVMHEAPVVDAPTWLVNLINNVTGFEIGDGDKNVYTGPVASEAALIKARAWMAEREPAISFQGGNDWTFKTACMLMIDFGLEDHDALELMREWNQRGDPWTDAELRGFIEHAKKYARGNVGSEDPAKDFAGLPNEIDDLPVIEGVVSKLNRQFKVVDDCGKLMVYRSIYDDVLGRSMWRRYRRTDFFEICQSQLMLPMVVNGKKPNGDPRFMPAGQYWLDHYRKKPTYGGLTMQPESNEKTPDGRLNLWQGFAVKEREGDWSLLKELIYETLCNWDEASYQYILNWMAKAVQTPWKPAGTALVLKGKKGAGKGTLGRAFMRLFGQHGMHITSRYQLSERFNAHLRDCVALFADEAYWAGDKAGESRLKGFITEPFLTYEAKGKDPEMGRNCLHIMMASNNDWIVPAGIDNERRFAVFEAADDSGMSRESWARLNHQLEHGGLEAMLYELMHRDISSFDVFVVPQTTALAEQKIHTMDPMIDWLVNETLNGWSDLTADEEGGYSTDDVYTSYLRSCESLKTRPQNQIAFGIALRKHLPNGLLTKKRTMQSGQRKYFYEFSEAEECIKHLSSMFGIKDLGL